MTGTRVLVVDDCPLMRWFIRRVLESSGYPVAAWREAGNGAEALGIMRAEMPDLVITDVNMPCMSGEDLLREKSVDPALRGIPVIVVSTDSTTDRVSRMLALGAAGYVAKPFLPETLLAQIERAQGMQNDHDD